MLASATDGVAAQATVASANVGQVITLVGSNFGPGTQVLFDTRSNTGVVSTVAVQPLAIDAAGTRLQVLVPDLATTGDLRVVNVGISNLGFNGSYNDAVYRQITRSFVAGGTSAVVRFADGGLQGLADESWGLDNVVVRQGSTVVFSDNFEGGAKAAWSDPTTDRSASGVFSEFSGRFNNTNQALTLSGLTAGQTYTLSFDLYALDSWDGSATSNGPDVFDVSVDGVSVLHESISNLSLANVQTLNASAAIRLQIVPTLSGLSGSGRPGQDAVFNLTGSGFMEGASTVTIGGVALVDRANSGSPFDVTGSAQRHDERGGPARPRRADPHHHRGRLCADRRPGLRRSAGGGLQRASQRVPLPASPPMRHKPRPTPGRSSC